jgi:hypothetical protein
MIIKLAYDSDYEFKDEYGICANRPLHVGHNLHKSLKSAEKDPHVILGLGIDGKRQDVKSFLKTNKNERFDWSVGMKKTNKIFDGKENKHIAILDYLRTKHGF